MVYSTTVLHQAVLMRDILENEGINALILNQQDSMYQTFGMIEVYVQDQDFERAKEIVEQRKE